MHETTQAPHTYKAPDGIRIYAVGDIHGRADLLLQLLEMIEDDHVKRGAGERIIIFLGDYVDRGPASREAVDMLLNLRADGANVRFLCGNHEWFVRDFLGDMARSALWMRNGGLSTLLSYDAPLDDLQNVDWSDIENAAPFRDEVAKLIPPAHLNFYGALETSARLGGYFFAHAGVRPGVALDAQSDHDLLWIREEFLESDQDFGAVVVHGHTPIPKPASLANRIGIDTLAWKSGRLTCVGLEGSDRWFLTTSAA